jgi:hypothetical protein
MLSAPSASVVLKLASLIGYRPGHLRPGRPRLLRSWLVMRPIGGRVAR